MAYVNTIPGMDCTKSDMYVLDLERKVPARKVLEQFRVKCEIKGVTLTLVSGESDGIAYLHAEPRRTECFPDGILVAIMYEKGRYFDSHLDSESRSFKVSGEKVTPELIDSVKEALSGS